MLRVSTPSPEFTRLVRSALAHFYDHAYLQNHPLALMLDARGQSDHVSRAQRLRRVLLECIESLKPEKQDHRRAEAARAHTILTCRYVDGLSVQEIAGELALSRQQIYREHEKGILAVASLLWEMVGANAKDELLISPSPSETEDNRLKIARAEVERLRQAVHTEFIDLGALLEGIFNVLAPLAQQAGVQIKLSAPGAWPLITADRVLIRQALLNLLTYALDVIQGELVVAVSQQDGGLLVEVREWRDNARIKPQSSPVPKRVGVGLMVARRLIEAQGGYIEVEERQGSWSARLYMPSASQTLVLVVDDNDDMVALFQRYLAGYAVSIVGVTDGQQALKLAAELRPRVITLDVMMPHQDGWEILQGLKKSSETKHIPVIVCSVLNEPRIAFSMGASDYLTKPISQASLLEALQRQLGALPPRV